MPKPQPAAPPDVVLTGVPRSGTTLACHLLNKLPDTVALHEPMQGLAHSDPSDHAALAREVQQFFDEQRTSIRDRQRALSRNIDGVVPDNPFAAETANGGVRPQIDSRGEIVVDKPLADDFTLVIKHTHRFAWMLEALVGAFPVYAIVRDPVATLSSWRTVDTRIRIGRSPAERATPELKASLGELDDELDRQIHLLAWFWEQFARYLPGDAIVTYESMIASGGRTLGPIQPLAAQLAEPLESRNTSALYDRQEMRRIGERLLRVDGAFWDWYPKEGVISFLDGLEPAEEEPASASAPASA